MIKTILKRITKPQPLESYDKYLFVSPHPDDSEMGCGATIAKLTQMGKVVYIVVATNGCVGSVDPCLTGDNLVRTRQAETKEACRIIGVDDKNIFFLPFDDGGDYDEAQLRYEIARLIVTLAPDVVFCPDHTVYTECHLDHIAVGRQTTYACVNVAPFSTLCEKHGIDGTYAVKLIAYYYTAKPNAYINVSKTFDRATHALTCHKSQFLPKDIPLINQYRRLRAVRFGARRFCRYADGYRVLPPLCQHCFPEAAEFCFSYLRNI